jgi:hypothetical protein
MLASKMTEQGINGQILLQQEKGFTNNFIHTQMS